MQISISTGAANAMVGTTGLKRRTGGWKYGAAYLRRNHAGRRQRRCWFRYVVGDYQERDKPADVDNPKRWYCQQAFRVHGQVWP